MDYLPNIEDLELSADALDRLRQLASLRKQLDMLTDQTVLDCRVHGMVGTIDVVGNETRHDTAPRATSWAKIGDALGISRQSAYERYRHMEDS